MKNKIIILLLVSFNAYASEYSFIDQPVELSINKKEAQVNFLIRAARYRILDNSACLSLIEEAIKTKSEIKITFSPKNLEIHDCAKL